MTNQRSPRNQRRRVGLILAALAGTTCALMAVRAAGAQPALPAMASSAPAKAASASIPARPMARPASRPEDGIRWQALTPEQRQALAPLEGEWPKIEAARKQKWLVLSARFRTMSPEERARITARMAEWARLTPAERGQARLRFQEAKDLPVSDRKGLWEAYQALPPEARQQLVARAASASRPPADRRRADAGPARPATSAPAAASQAQAKVNTVPFPATGQQPRAVAPTVVQAAPGATTNAITKRPMPPAHQQSGMPKIAATPDFVSRATLLPQRGPQAAGIASAPVVRPTVVPIRPLAPAPTVPAASQPAAVETPAPPRLP